MKQHLFSPVVPYSFVEQYDPSKQLLSGQSLEAAGFTVALSVAATFYTAASLRAIVEVWRRDATGRHELRHGSHSTEIVRLVLVLRRTSVHLQNLANKAIRARRDP